jgi:hypothetical protein
MSDTVAATPAPKKPIFTVKNLFIAIAVVLGLFGLDHYTLNLVSGGSVTVTDSTIVVSAPVVDVPAVADTVKADTTKK